MWLYTDKDYFGSIFSLGFRMFKVKKLNEEFPSVLILALLVFDRKGKQFQSCIPTKNAPLVLTFESLDNIIISVIFSTAFTLCF